MKTSERFDRAIRALVKGFFNETLVKGHCAGCAIGNIVAESIGCKVLIAPKSLGLDSLLYPNEHWSAVFCTNPSANGGFRQKFDPYEERGKAKENIVATGYCSLDLAAIETAFERNTRIHYTLYNKYTKQEIIEDQYNGLMAVVNELCNIEGIESKEYKDMFSYTEEFKPVNVYE